MKPKLVLCNGWRGVQAHVQDALVQISSREPLSPRSMLILVPTTAAAHLVRLGLEQSLLEGRSARVFPVVSSAHQMFVRLSERSLGKVRLADPLSREAILEGSLLEAEQSGASPPFAFRGSLGPRVLALYDRLFLTSHSLEAFAARAFQEFDVPGDLGAERMTAETRFLIDGLERYRQTLRHLRLEDPTTLPTALAEGGVELPYREVMALGPEALQPAGLAYLASVSGLRSLEIVIPKSLSQAHPVRALLNTVPMETVEMKAPFERPLWLTPETASPPRPSPATGHLRTAASESAVFLFRDREEVLAEVARLLKARALAGKLPPLERVAVVVPSPLAYLYLVKKVFDQAGVPYELQDDFPLATEPYVAAADLVLEFVERRGHRSAALDLLRSPFFRLPGVDPATLAAFDDDVAKHRSRGGFETWRRMHEDWRRRPLQRALPGMEGLLSHRTPASVLEALVTISDRLIRLGQPGTSLSEKTDVLRRFLESFGRPLASMVDSERHERARGALISILERLSEAARLVGDPPVPFSTFREKLHRAIESHTFSIRSGRGGVQIVEAGSAGYGTFDLVVLVGLNEGEWPTRSERNIFYPQWMLKDFGWPTDVDALAFERAAFIELLRLASGSVALFRHQLEDDIPTVPSPFVEEIDGGTEETPERVSSDETTGLLISRAEALRWGAMVAKMPVQSRLQPGWLSQSVYDPEPVSATAFEMYLRCPFKHFSRYVLGLEEEEDLEEALTPLERGRILHDILQAGFERWDMKAAGPRPITPDNYAEAVALFQNVAAEKLPLERRSLEMARLFGGVGESGSIEWLLRMEMGRGALRRRLLEHAFQNEFRLSEGPYGETPWRVKIKGRVDRVDVDSDGRLHLFDYKSGRAPDVKVTIQLPLYALCLSQELGAPTARAAYLSLREKRAVARPDSSQAERLLRETYREMKEGRFPPRPYQDHLCHTCGYVGLCRKEIEETHIGREDEAS